MALEDKSLPEPSATRLERPSWKDTRLVAGVVIMLVAIAMSALTLRHFDSSVEVSEAAHNLLPGDRIAAADIRTVKVRLDGDHRRYLAGPAIGSQVVREVRAGELIPASAVSDSHTATSRSVAVPVDPAQAATLVKGSVVDIWVAAHTPGSTGTNDFLEPRRQAERALVTRTPSSGSGFNAVRDDYVMLQVGDDKVADIVSATNRGAKITLVPTADSPMRAG